MPGEQSNKIPLPNHIGFILDGNRRWAKEQGLPSLKGHYRGAEVLKEISTIAFKNGIRYVSAYIFSTENWNRTKDEVSYLMRLIPHFIEKYVDELEQNGIKITFVGSTEGLPKAAAQALEKAERRTQDCKNGTLALCINYGGQQEIVDAAKKLLRHKVDPKRLSIKEFETALYAPEIPPLDLVVRTSGEYRTSGFMLWRAAYAEYIFVDKLWPDFSKQDLKAVLLYYAKRERRFGV